MSTGLQVKHHRFGARGTAAAALLVVCGAVGLALAQAPAPVAPQNAQMTMVPNSKMKPPPDPMRDFAGLNFTDEQKAKIRQIREDGKKRLDAVARDDKLDPEARDAMLRGFQRIERNRIFEVLTPEQQTDVRKRVLARRNAAAQKAQKPQRPEQGGSSPPPR